MVSECVERMANAFEAARREENVNDEDSDEKERRMRPVFILENLGPYSNGVDAIVAFSSLSLSLSIS